MEKEFDIKKSTSDHSEKNLGMIQNISIQRKETFIEYVCFIVMGVINNMGFTLIITTSEQLALHFQKINLMPLIQL